MPLGLPNRVLIIASQWVGWLPGALLKTGPKADCRPNINLGKPHLGTRCIELVLRFLGLASEVQYLR